MLRKLKINGNIKKRLIELGIYLLLFCYAIVMYLIFKPLYSEIRNGVYSQCLTILSLAIIFIVGVILKKTNKLSLEMLLLLLVLASFAIRLGYMLSTPYNCRQHDTITNNNDGHEAYAWIIYTQNALPSSNVYQFYHPPLNAFTQSCFMHFMKPILELYNSLKGEIVYDTTQMHVMYQTCQILSLMYMTLCGTIGIKIIKYFKMGRKSFLIGSLFILFYPRLIQLSGQLNNDAICVMFSFLTILFSLRWWKSRSWFDIIILALSIGLAMNSKLSGAVICAPTAFIFIYEFVKAIKNKDYSYLRKLCIQYVVFLLICAPIGLWFQVYAYIRFDQKFGHVFSNLNSALSVAEYNFFERFINPFDFKDLTVDLFARAFENYNLFNYTVKSSLFGEFRYWQGEGFAFIAIATNYIIGLLSGILFAIYLIDSKKEDFKGEIVALTILISQCLAMLYFNIKMPYGCTMDFRYIVPIIIGFGIMLNLVNEKYSSKGKGKILVDIMNTLVCIMIVASNIFYIVCI